MTRAAIRRPVDQTLAAGDSTTLGATVRDGGCHFALFSAEAEAVELCLYTHDGSTETARHRLQPGEGNIWHGFLAAAGAGTCYGYRVYGPHEPEVGLRFNPNKLLLDPYARALRGNFVWHDSHLGYRRDDPAADLSFCDVDNSAVMPKAVVTEAPAPGPSRRPGIPLADTWLYELHLAGFTRRHPAVPGTLRGTCDGLAHPASLEYLRALGITAVELLPVHAFIDEYALHQRGLKNYWGYNTLAFFVPHPAYTGDAGAAAFRAMVDAVHDAGLEVILDVVYNHSAESDELGPTLSLRGIDNRSYYRLEHDRPRYYVNDTGCGNTLDTQHPIVRRLVMDSLRFWARDMDVDGFRFDLAPVLGRGHRHYQPDAALLRDINSDPVLRQCKLIGEPWDIGPDGYQLGNLPGGWSEWNDRYRDSVRRFWRGDDAQLPELGRRLTGSGDIFAPRENAPTASINYVCSHDGFTLRDLVSYRERHNAINGENNRDGHADNLSDNLGVEGPSSDRETEHRRWQRQRNIIATLAVSQGVPMLQAGDEFGRSQRGNNNAYCQDNPLTWLDWAPLSADARQLRLLTQRLIDFRARSALLRADRYRHEHPDIDGQCIRWYGADGQPATAAHWQDPARRDILYALLQCDPGEAIEDAVLVVLNAGDEALTYRVPAGMPRPRLLLVDTADKAPASRTQGIDDALLLAPGSLQIALAGIGAVAHTDRCTDTAGTCTELAL